MRNRTQRLATLLSILAVIAVAIPPASSTEVLPTGLKIEKVLDNAVELGNVVESPTGELWLLERTTGVMRVFVGGVQKASLTLGVTSTCESGLLDVTFAPDYGQSGRAFVSYVNAGGTLVIDKLLRSPAAVALDGNLLTFGAVTGGCRPGGALAVTPDGKLLVGVGDLGTSSNAQNGSALAGKVLRVNLDGSVPADNPTPGSLVFAKGFRDGKDIDVNPSSGRTNGTIYLADLGAAASAKDELNAVRSGGNYGWDATSGSSGGIYDDPLVSYDPVVNTEALAALTKTNFGGKNVGSVTYTCVDADEVRQAFLTGPELAQLDSTRPFFDPDGDADGTPDAGCPKLVNALGEGRDGWLYAGNKGANPAIWRIWRDTPGPREVSAKGSPFPVLVEKSGSNLKVNWENLGALDAGRAKRFASGQRATAYRISEGTLPISGSYSHAPLVDTDGTLDGPARRSTTITPGSGNRYYLVSAQGDNFEGTLGSASSGAARPGQSDYCQTIGYAHRLNKCHTEWYKPGTSQVMKLRDWNPRSPTYGQDLSLSDIRGNVIKLTLSADDCGPCNSQADTENATDKKYAGRDYRAVTILVKKIASGEAFPPSECQSGILAWTNRHPTQNTPLLCDVDTNGDKWGDVTLQLWNSGLNPLSDPDWCSGFPHNYYIDQGHVEHAFTCGFSPGDIESKVAPEVNAESCE